MPEQDHDAVVERFPATSGRFSGVLGLVLVSVFLVLSVLAWDPGRPLGVAILSVLGAVLIWAVLLRPAVWSDGRALVLRGIFHTTRIPLAAIDSVIVTQVLAIRVGEHRYTSPAIGYTARQNTKRRLKGRSNDDLPRPEETLVAQAFVESRIRHLAQDTRERTGVRQGSPEQAALAAAVRRTWAWPELAAVALLALGWIVWLAS
ncbi:hypothetical protein GON03_06465 [Nocardioides sp. MAH-18]|uniref:PH domain-containing protein n=1 Tax=Nocardioides agri TaxID=2682843 RepID=A0A6L6XNX6_9ACTN|nr:MULTISPECIES: hypothetical protein [unclassified Nocardioides]MBA2953958.1 hypothetical protein [Nocardioides sp. CGMCC 1.13656]MVQ48820.1 hypothetical protein [Nocardioides sp. MAH-18]